MLTRVWIIAVHRGAFQALGDGEIAWCELTGRAFHDAADKRALPTIGDWVRVEGWAEAVAGGGAAVIRDVEPRKSLLVRKAAGEASVPQPIAANVDVGIVMTSANKDLSAARLDRYATLLRDGGIAPAFVLSKVDLVADPAPLLAELAACAPAGAPIIGVSVITGQGVDAVRALASPDRTAVLLGSSGVGKSSLLNALVGSLVQPTQPIRDDERGKHTTTRRELFMTDAGTWIDTPGMRELAQWIDEGGDDAVFDDIAALAEHCKFRDCRHRAEPGCAVRDVADPARLASFHKLTDERAAAEARQNAARRIAESRRAKAKKPTDPSRE
jgi:ribosome biogenesis GTPase